MKLKWVFMCHQSTELQKGTSFIFQAIFNSLILCLTGLQHLSLLTDVLFDVWYR